MIEDLKADSARLEAELRWRSAQPETSPDLDLNQYAGFISDYSFRKSQPNIPATSPSAPGFASPSPRIQSEWQVLHTPWIPTNEVSSEGSLDSE